MLRERASLAPLLLAVTVVLPTFGRQTDTPATPTVEKCKLEGAVSDAVTGEGLRKVAVQLTGWFDSGSNYLTTTDVSGHFAFNTIAAGDYWLHGARAGYLETSLGARRPDAKGTVVRLKAGEVISNLNLKLVPGSIISGKLTDESGEPVVGARVEAYRPTRSRRHREFGTWGQQDLSNDAGEYRITGLAAGQYYLYVSPNQDAYLDEQGKPEKRLLAAFYPDGPTLESATLVEISTGQTTTGINFRIREAETFAVHGKIATRPRGAQEPTVVASRKGLDMENWPAGENEAKPDGTFEIRGLPKGSYQLQVGIREPDEYGSSSLPIEIKTGDLSGVVLPVPTPVEIAGIVHFDNGAIRILGDAIRLFESDTGRSSNTLIPIKEDLTFRASIAARRYVVALPTLPGDDYVKSISCGGREVLGQVIDFSQGVLGEFEITVAKGAGRVEGAITLPAPDDGSDAKEGVLGVQVALIADQIRFDTDDAFIAETDQTGHFSFSRVPPGKYYAFAARDVQVDLWRDRDFLDQIRGDGVEVNVAENGRVQIEPTPLAASKVERALAAIGL